MELFARLDMSCARSSEARTMAPIEYCWSRRAPCPRRVVADVEKLSDVVASTTMMSDAFGVDTRRFHFRFLPARYAFSAAEHHLRV